MIMVKSLYLHVGYGKTGSSAIQSWLANNVATLKNAGFSYSLKDQDSIHYRVSSGNGQPLCDYLVGGLSETNLWQHYFQHELPNTLISSEVLPWCVESVAKLKDFCAKHDIQLKLIAYVRDLIDYSYSAYVQSVKRHNSLATFSQYVDHLCVFDHVELALLKRQHQLNVTYVHYNSHLSDVTAPFADWLGMDLQAFTPLNKKVNRTLTTDEVVVLQQFVRWREFYCNDLPEFNISQLISDWLIHQYPDTPKSVLINSQDVESLTRKFAPAIEHFNEVIGRECGLSLSYAVTNQQSLAIDQAVGALNLTLFNKVLAYLVGLDEIILPNFRLALLIESYNISPDFVMHLLNQEKYSDYQTLLPVFGLLKTLTKAQWQALFEMLTTRVEVVRHEQLQSDDYLLFRDAALAVESSDALMALKLMTLAKVARPNGPLIINRINKYNKQLGIKK